MATFETLIEEKALFRVTVPLGQKQFHDRKFYAFPGCLNWMRTEVPGMVTGRIKSATTPKDQMLVRLREWMSGARMIESRAYRHMTPHENDVYELKTDDLRIFGWCYQPGIFIAVSGGYADDYKAPTKTKNYADDIRAVVEARNALPLDGEKVSKGNFDDIC